MRFSKVKTPRDRAHLERLRMLPCAFCHNPGPSEVSHHGQHGIAIKASDYEALPACHSCHARWHQCGSPHPSWDHLTREEKRERFGELARKIAERYGLHYDGRSTGGSLDGQEREGSEPRKADPSKDEKG